MSESLKPFNLERAKAGDPIVTCDGRKAKFIAHVPEAKDTAKVVVLITSNVYSFRENGRVWSWEDDQMDLYMASKKRTVWVNLYLDGTTDSEFFDAKDEADRYASHSRIGGKAYPIEIEE